MNGISPKQEAFCMAYAESGNAKQAYMQAGYKVNSENAAAAAATRLLKNVNIKNRLQEIHKQIASDAIMGPKEMQERLTKIARQEATESVLTQDGGEVQRKADFKAALKAMELLGKMQGSFIERREVNMNAGVVVIRDDVPETD